MTVACRDNPVSLPESAQALDDVLAVVPQRGRKGALGRCAAGFLQSMALHLSVGVCVDEWLFELERGRYTSRLLWVIYAGVPAVRPGGGVGGGS